MKKKIPGVRVPHQSPPSEVLGALGSEEGLPPESREQWAYVIAHQADLRRYAGRVIGRLDGFGPRIVFNAALLKVYNTLKNGPVDNVRTYFMRVASNEAIDYYRQLARTRKHEISAGEDMSLVQQDHAFGDLGVDKRQQMNRYVESLRSELTEQELTAFVLTKFDGLSANEVAAAMSELDGEMTASNVRQAVWRARRKLRTEGALARLGLAVAD
ncbi:sigma-70 family RNA polymerase sigma factor [Streptomyces sp. NPDC048361]|uniref:RNA polymerase sigma factor n=1 Tax=Streptomyces sp. NPDC048361 TaxID=3154720 RepID=UPI00342E1B2C